jgi:tetratricopeptide (TPR) repeat protein
MPFIRKSATNGRDVARLRCLRRSRLCPWGPDLRLIAACLLFFSMCGAVASTPVSASPPPAYFEAIDLIHAYSGSGDELHRAIEIADGLARSHPRSGYSQALLAEGLSTWRLGQDGEPAMMRDAVIELAEEALRLDPQLPLAHVAKARALLRASMYVPAETSIERALAIDPAHSGALFLRAEIFRRTGNLVDGDAWYRKFIAAAASPVRRSNGYYWLARMYEDAHGDNAVERQALAAKARESYERMFELDPDAPAKNANFAAFLNDLGDFDAAERHAQRSLEVAEFAMARYQLAAARYQKLWTEREALGRTALRQALRRVAFATGVSLQSALDFPFSAAVLSRLEELQSRARIPLPH